MKRRLVLAGAISAVLAILAFGTLAYFTAEGRAANVITTGTVALTLTEEGEGVPLAGGTGMVFTGVMPGQVVSKQPIVTNDGSEAFYARVKVDILIQPAPEHGGATLSSALVQPGIDKAKWVDGGDGWYYYAGTVKPGASVSPFGTVTFAPEMGNDYQNCTVTLSLHAQAVQMKNNPIPAGGSILDVQGWPEATA
jgi:predicted ribosomally synthesized peptide with SipW-like signal peptide